MRHLNLLWVHNQLQIRSSARVWQVGRERQGGGHRSGCPINLSLEVLGDTWSLLIVRDLIFGNARHFRELLRSEEGISSNVLSDRLRKLAAEGLVTSSDDPTHKQKTIYRLTEKGIALLPVLVQLGVWGRRYLPATDELSIRLEVLAEGGPVLWERFMAELRENHLTAGATDPDRASPPGSPVRDLLEAAHQDLVRGR
jgi:DNA-binding HxlR family transcriptional regulator